MQEILETPITPITPKKNPIGQFLFDEHLVHQYWAHSLPPELESNETIRIVLQASSLDTDQGKPPAYTPNAQYRTAIDVMNAVNNYQDQYPDRLVGVSISTTVFNYESGRAPSKATFKYTDTIAIDIDTHIGRTKDRYKLCDLEEDQQRYAVLRTWVEMASAFYANSIQFVVPKATLLTGGGLQFILGFDRRLNQSEAERIFGLIKMAIGGLKFNATLVDKLGTISEIGLDIDKSFADITHVQRCAGFINQKYGVMSKEVNLFNLSPEEIHIFKKRLFVELDMSSSSTEVIKKYKEAFEIQFINLAAGMKKAPLLLDIKEHLITAKMQSARSVIGQGELKGVEYDLLSKIKAKGPEFNILDLMPEIKIGPNTGNLTKIYCPFHEERNPSMAFYKNELFDVFKDFHDGETYSLVTLWQKLYDVSKSDAISQISDKAGIALGKSERKEFQDLELQEIVDKLLSKVDQEKYVYYRMANKNRTCIVRKINSGETYPFDGHKMLARHVLSNQLKIDDVGEEMDFLFAKRFQEKILIDAFEEFNPGKPTIFSKEFIKFVNLWVPSDNYKAVHSRYNEIKENIPEKFSVKETIDTLKKRTPWTYKYILQVVQNGDLEWFIQWLHAVANFRSMPTVPVIFGVQGAGKNLFVNTIMDFYLNNEYVKVVSGDRIMQQFNSILETTNLLVLDEGDFSNGKEIDQLKLLTGNDKILIEKKGVDATNKTKHFNIMFFSNGEVPLRHPAMDRRISYFNNEIPLLASTEAWGLPSIDNFIEKVKSELVDFWAIILHEDADEKVYMQNSKNGQFWKQILMQHPFGALIVKLMNGEWEDIALQLNENVQDSAELQMNLKLLENIQLQFEKDGKISLTLINRYISSLNYRMKQSIQKFIQTNHLHEFGITTLIEEDDVKIVVNRKKVLETLKVINVLKKAYPKTAKEEVSPLEAELAAESVDVLQEVEHLASPNQSLIPPEPPKGRIQSENY